MLGLISFSIKIILASVMGGAINYVSEKQENSENIFNTALICIFSTAILAITKELSSVGDNFLMGFGIFSVFMVIIFISKNLTFIKRMNWLFASLIGIILGVGYIIHAIILTILIYYILHNTEDVLDFIYKNNDVSQDSARLEQDS